MPAVKAPRNAAAKIKTVSVRLPIGEVPDDEMPNRPVRLNVHLSGRSADAMRSVRDGFRAQKATLEDGRPVWTTADALRHLIESIDSSSP